MVKKIIDDMESKHGLRTFILSYMNHHRGIPFNAKTMIALFGRYGYKHTYMVLELSKLKRVRYINETDTFGTYCFTKENFTTIKFTNPQLAKVISAKIYPKDEKWQV